MDWHNNYWMDCHEMMYILMLSPACIMFALSCCQVRIHLLTAQCKQTKGCFVCLSTWSSAVLLFSISTCFARVPLTTGHKFDGWYTFSQMFDTSSRQQDTAAPQWKHPYTSSEKGTVWVLSLWTIVQSILSWQTKQRHVFCVYVSSICVSSFTICNLSTACCSCF